MSDSFNSLGISVNMFATITELNKAKNGSTMIVGVTDITDYSSPNDYASITIPLSACEFSGKEVRVNLAKIKQEQEAMGKQLGDIMGTAMTNAMMEGISKL